ncbi:MAG: ATP-dependent sacrificial sulfur transferase LarE [Phycisphaerae bacterium]
MGDSMLQTKLDRMRTCLRELRSVAVAFSGGVDSTFVLKVAADTLGRDCVVAVTGRSPSIPEQELEDARRLAELIGVEHVVIDTDEFSDPNYLANPTNRCYFCKTELYGKLADFIAGRGIRHMLNGTNADDLGDYRPGLKAASEFEVHAPIADAGLSKADVRRLSAELGLPTADKPAAPCLSSRIPYGAAVTPEKLSMIERAERLLHELGFRECRVRHHDNMARIEVPSDQIEALMQPETRARVESGLRDIGYAYVTVDLRGLRSGSLNEVIAFGRVQAPLQ